MDYEAIAGMFVGVTFILTVGGVFLLRPVTKELGSYLRAATRRQQVPPSAAASEPVLEALARIEQRLSLLEDRQEFAEELMRGRIAQDVAEKILDRPPPHR